MAINKEKNERITITIDKELKALIQEYAAKDTRTMTSYVIQSVKERIVSDMLQEKQNNIQIYILNIDNEYKKLTKDYFIIIIKLI